MGYDMEMEEFHDDMKMDEALKKELEKLLKEITEEAKSVVEDYIKNPSELSGSALHIHPDSPFLKEKE
tara:strand:+ start:590 stop:793 length:204 start_codon:yes stop_codon:yes gene_type:complete